MHRVMLFAMGLLLLAMGSVYHLDGADLRVTHYCAAQNQPRLRATSFGTDNSDIRFSFVDITNLRSPSDGHVSGLENTISRTGPHQHNVSIHEHWQGRLRTG